MAHKAPLGAKGGVKTPARGEPLHPSRERTPEPDVMRCPACRDNIAEHGEFNHLVLDCDGCPTCCAKVDLYCERCEMPISAWCAKECAVCGDPMCHHCDYNGDVCGEECERARQVLDALS